MEDKEFFLVIKIE
ncbi:hypothetical protein CGSSp23BS72_09568 [Streptococcus pneumoniae SP23-BS72]|nr:hypothetical protein CGSSp14BS69_02564 [Streptococcus pneumoniae SP14-BS69]EDK67889.1 hypothetical protein CGSSp18BS74_11074 [Streptococcus pneumoniae SP18-BS74]EDK71130.1 hypothetical protein CGSSp19BS75_07362 [Streptococcus pneumoniae SP19-BS75]EDK81025.1 hypothetical protein CGSSp23BS72_09568 [Streptococcus pneumoniae SP23-BS72]